jgi:hypothetical protein
VADHAGRAATCWSGWAGNSSHSSDGRPSLSGGSVTTVGAVCPVAWLAAAALRAVATCPADQLARYRCIATDVIGKLDEIPVGIAEVDAHHVSVSSGLLDWSDFDCHPGCRELRLYAVEVVIDDQA